MSAQLLCVRCGEPIVADHLTETLVEALLVWAVHVDCDDPAGDQVYDCRRRLDMATRKSSKKRPTKKSRY